jgi:hypothetical protein
MSLLWRQCATRALQPLQLHMLAAGDEATAVCIREGELVYMHLQ